MKNLEKEYRKWGTVALCCVMTLLFTIATIDSFLEFDFSKNMYLMSIVATACLLAIISMSWIRLLNCKLMRTDLVEPPKPISKPAEQNSITLADVEMCIKREGYVPQVEDGITFFKISGERVEAIFQDEKFTLSKRFALGDDVDRDLLLRACSQAQDEIFMFRSFIHSYDNGQSVICFEVETYLNSVSDLDRYFPHFLNLMMHAIARQQEIYSQMRDAEHSRADERKSPASKEPRVVS